MKLKIAFLQLLPTESLQGNIENGIRACREVWGNRNRRPELYGIISKSEEEISC